MSKKELTLLDVHTLISEWSELVSSLSFSTKENTSSQFKVSLPFEPTYQAVVSIEVQFEENQDDNWIKYPAINLENYNDRLEELKEMLLTVHKLPNDIH
jgi:hypothetical protein